MVQFAQVDPAIAKYGHVWHRHECKHELLWIVSLLYVEVFPGEEAFLNCVEKLDSRVQATYNKFQWLHLIVLLKPASHCVSAVKVCRNDALEVG